MQRSCLIPFGKEHVKRFENQFVQSFHSFKSRFISQSSGRRFLTLCLNFPPRHANALHLFTVNHHCLSSRLFTTALVAILDKACRHVRSLVSKRKGLNISLYSLSMAAFCLDKRRELASCFGASLFKRQFFLFRLSLRLSKHGVCHEPKLFADGKTN